MLPVHSDSKTSPKVEPGHSLAHQRYLCCMVVICTATSVLALLQCLWLCHSDNKTAHIILSPAVLNYVCMPVGIIQKVGYQVILVHYLLIVGHPDILHLLLLCSMSVVKIIDLSAYCWARYLPSSHITVPVYMHLCLSTSTCT